jgi:hypothetical protein
MNSTLKKDEKAFVAMPMGNISTLVVVGASKMQRGANGNYLLPTVI